MAAVSVTQLLTLYAWFPLAFLLVFVLLIARFYQKFASVRTFFYLYTVPIFLFGAALVRYAGLNRINGDGLADVLFGLAGISLASLSAALYYLMTRKQH